MSEGATRLKVLPELCQESIVKMFESLLKDAKEGKLRTAVVAYETPEMYGTLWAGDSDQAKKIGMLELSKAEIAGWRAKH